MKENSGSISRRQFLKGAGAVTVGAVALGVLGGCAGGAEAAAEVTPTPAPTPEITPVPASAPAAPAAYEGGARVLAFTSDQHAEHPGFRAWLEDQKAVYGDDLEFLAYGGDICDKAWVPEVFDTFRATLDELMPGKYGVTTGNQENKPGAPAGEAWDALGPGFVRLGEVVQTPDYCIFNFGAAQETMNFPPDDIQALADYLDTTPKNIPIFVVSHFPLHLSVPYSYHDIPGGYRQAQGNDALTEVLNRHPNVIFLWGHNHTFQDPRYGTVRPAGSRFTWDISDTTKKLETNFTYANLGSFCRGDTYGAIAELRRDGDVITVKLYYVDTNVPMENKERAVITFLPDGTVTCDTTEPPEGSINFVDMFYLAGWYDDPTFAEDY